MMCHHSSVGCWVLGHACEIMWLVPIS
jgi:hypothetical protein